MGRPVTVDRKMKIFTMGINAVDENLKNISSIGRQCTLIINVSVFFCMFRNEI